LQTRTVKKRLTPLFDFGLTHAPFRTEGLDRKYTTVGKYRERQPHHLTRGLAQAGHYLAWRNFCGKEKLILSRASLLEAPPAAKPLGVGRNSRTAIGIKKKIPHRQYQIDYQWINFYWGLIGAKSAFGNYGNLL
jgi:hypothetical protein